MLGTKIAFTFTPYTLFIEQCQTKIKDKIHQVDSKYKGQGPKDITLTDQPGTTMHTHLIAIYHATE